MYIIKTYIYILEELPCNVRPSEVNHTWGGRLHSIPTCWGTASTGVAWGTSTKQGNPMHENMTSTWDIMRHRQNLLQAKKHVNLRGYLFVVGPYEFTVLRYLDPLSNLPYYIGLRLLWPWLTDFRNPKVSREPQPTSMWNSILYIFLPHFATSVLCLHLMQSCAYPLGSPSLVQ